MENEVIYLLPMGLHINQQQEGIVRLHGAIYADDMAWFYLLLEGGADPLMVDISGRNVLALASDKGKIDAVTALLQLEQVRDAINTQTKKTGSTHRRVNSHF